MSEIVNSDVINKEAKLAERFEKYLDAQHYSIVCLQETKLGPKSLKLVEYLSNMSNWNFAISDPFTGTSGVAVFSRRELKANVIPGMDGDERYTTEGRVLTTFIGSLAIINVYVPNGNRFKERQEFKLQFLDDLMKHCERLRKEHLVIIAGDFNVVPADKDIATDFSKFDTSEFPSLSNQERAWFKDLEGFGFNDSY